MHDKGCKNLSGIAAPGNFGLPRANLRTCSPRQHWLAGDQVLARLLLFSVLKRSGQDMQNPANQRKRRNRKKDVDSTSKLGVSSCLALSTLTKDETRLSMHAKT